MDTSSPFVLLRTANGLVSIDARTIAGNIGRFEREPHVLLLETTTSTPFTLKFASCAEADAAVERLHVAREKVAALPDLAALLAEVHQDRLPAHVEVEGVQRRDWGEFREAGMVYAANTILQWFGWSLVASYDDKSGKLLEVFPARADHRGFTAESNARGIERLTLWMEKASPALLAEVHHEPPTEPPMVVDARR